MTIYTIDDVYGDSRLGNGTNVPVYLPNDPSIIQWDPVGGTCSYCGNGARFNPPLDRTQIYDVTWHTVTMNPGEPVTTITATFTGKTHSFDME